MINWQLSKQGIRWPVSRDLIAGSDQELTKVACKQSKCRDLHLKWLHCETNDNTLNYCIYHNEQQQPFPRYKFMFHHFGFVSWTFSSQSTTLKFPIWTDHKICPSNWASTVTGLIWRGPQNPTICAISKLVNVESMQSRCKTLHFTSNLAHISIL